MPIKLLFLILAHDRPEQVAELASGLSAAGSDAHAIIHFDANAPEETFRRLAGLVEGMPRVHLARDRARGRWGGYGLVQAVFNMIGEAERLGLEPTHAVLLSGSCLPCRPIATLERFLAANPGREFIEVADEGWIRGGLRAERHTLYHPFDMKRTPRLEKASVLFQRVLRVRRRFPRGLTPRYGSQWWCLTWETCRRLLGYARANPRTMAFFHTVWIPDEMVFPTLVHALCPWQAIAGTTLTHFQFTDRGKPIIFHDDHADYVPSLDRFFFRKASPSAGVLRARCLSLAAASDDGTTPQLDAWRQDYEIMMRLQTHFPKPGQIFYRDQYDDMSATVLSRCEVPYVVLFGPRALTAPALAMLRAPGFVRLGAVFDPHRVDFGPDRPVLGGLRPGDVPLRDLHPALFLTRVRQRCDGVAAMLWGIEDAPRLMEEIGRDPRALVVACLPFAASPQEAMVSVVAMGEGRHPPLPRGDEPKVKAMFSQSYADAMERRLGPAARWLLSVVRGDEPGGPRVIVMPHDTAATTLATRRRLFRRSLAECGFKDEPWFPALADDLVAAWSSVGYETQEPMAVRRVAE